MCTYDPLAVRRVLGPDWIISHDGEDYADGKHNKPPALPPQKPPPHKSDDDIPTVYPEAPHPYPHPYPQHHPFAYRTVYGTGPAQGFLGVCCLGLGVFFFALPTSSATLWLGGAFISTAFFFFCAASCCWGPVQNNTVVNNHGYTGNLPPVMQPNWRPGAPPFVPGTMPYAPVYPQAV